MNSSERQLLKILKLDLLNKFNFKNIQKLLKIKKIILSFVFKTIDIKTAAKSLLALEIISGQKVIITKSKFSNVQIKIKKGNPIGCKVKISKKQIFSFLSKIVIDIICKNKDINELYHIFKFNKRSFYFEITELLHFSELEKNYNFFHNLSNLKITIITNSNTKEELMFFFKSLQFPI